MNKKLYCIYKCVTCLCYLKLWLFSQFLKYSKKEKSSICVYKVILFSLEKEENPAICDNVDENRGWNKPDSDTAWSYLYVEYKKVELIKAENRMLVTRDGGNVEILVKEY